MQRQTDAKATTIAKAQGHCRPLIAKTIGSCTGRCLNDIVLIVEVTYQIIDHFFNVLFMTIAYGYESRWRHGDYLPRPIVGLLVPVSG